MTKKTIAVLTSGGDCAGLNAVIRAVTDHAAGTKHWSVIGIKNGHLGLLEKPRQIVRLTVDSVRGDLMRAGGTMLGTTTRGDPFEFPGADGSVTDRSGEVVNALKSVGVDGVVVIGGDGSMRLFHRLLTPAGIPWVGVPKTIDNDVPGTDFAVGFFSAVDIVSDSLDRLASTAASHKRIMVLEVMGRDSGYIAMFGGIAGGADAILIPEIEYDIDKLAAHINKITHARPSPVLIVVAEGAHRPPGDRRTGGDVGQSIAFHLQKRTNIEARCTVLGHLQRGGSPIAFDRLIASSFGVHAVDLLAQNISGRLVAWQRGIVTDVRIEEAVTGPRLVPINGETVKTARGLGIYIGELTG
ncbi:MAG: ATP-dependent 6-phosphofructokinase [Rhodobacteraceae bacterium]|nr:ATP-dependent 6-phosphofructokinase [Paracoccaceae bacterium]